MGGKEPQENRMQYFPVYLTKEDMSHAEELKKVAISYFESLGFYNRSQPLKSPAAQDQIASLFMEMTSNNPVFTLEEKNPGARIGGGYRVSSLTDANTPFILSLHSFSGERNSSGLRYRIKQRLNSNCRAHYGDIANFSRAYAEQHGFFDMDKPVTTECLETHLLAQLRLLQRTHPSIYDPQSHTYLGAFKLSVVKANAEKGRKGILIVSLIPENSAARLEWDYVPGQVAEIGTNSFDDSLTESLQKHGIQFLTSLGLREQPLQKVMTRERLIPANLIKPGLIKLVPPGERMRDHYSILLLKKRDYALYISTGSIDRDQAQRCLDAIKNEYVPACQASRKPVSRQDAEAFLAGCGLGSEIRQISAPPLLVGSGEKALGRLYFNFVHTSEDCSRVSIAISPTNRYSENTTWLTIDLEQENLREKIERVRRCTEYILDNYYETGRMLAAPDAAGHDPEALQDIKSLLKINLHKAKDLYLRTNFEPDPAGNGKYLLHIIPERNFGDPLEVNGIPGTITLVAPDKESAQRFERMAFACVEKKDATGA